MVRVLFYTILLTSALLLITIFFNKTDDAGSLDVAKTMAKAFITVIAAIGYIPEFGRTHPVGIRCVIRYVFQKRKGFTGRRTFYAR